MDDRARAKRLLVPGLAAAGLIVLLATLLMLGSQSGGSSSSSSVNDPELKDIGEGLKIRDIQVGEGEPVQPGATVTVHYTGWLTNGKVFDSSRERAQPATFSLNDVIEGWKRGIPGMKPGGIRKLVIPSHLAYGSTGQGVIPPNATLIFEVELLPGP